jgi:1,4-alpha-glucan branching enzyme
LDAPESRNRTLLNTFKKLIQLRHQLAALRGDNLEFFYENHDDRILAYSRRSDKQELVIIVAHFSPNNRNGYTLKNIPVKEKTQFVNGLNEEEIIYSDNGTNEIKMNLKPFEVKILIEKQQQ